jgi:DNA-binding transcriptional MerR regulator
MDRTGDGLSVGAASAEVGLTVHTLRWYEQEGLLWPVARDSAGHRRYSKRDLDWLRLLIRLRTTGMPVREMRRYAELARRGDATAGERLQMFVAHRERLLAHLAELQRDLSVIDYKIEIYRGMEGSQDEVTNAG